LPSLAVALPDRILLPLRLATPFGANQRHKSGTISLPAVFMDRNGLFSAARNARRAILGST